jgi:hypothetical protein
MGGYMNQLLYFGHPVNTYGTSLENRLIQLILERFEGAIIENPNMPEHQKGYEEWKATHDNGMAYFTEIVLPRCIGGVFLPFRDGAWGAGVHKEALWFAARGLPVWSIDTDGVIIHFLPSDSNLKVLTPEETRLRIRDEKGKSLPY